MLPLQIIERLENPAEMQENFLHFLSVNKAAINQNKTIAYQTLYDAREIINKNNIEFFKGVAVNQLSNVKGSFIRPESEHFLIYGIRMYFTQEKEPLITAPNWERGLDVVAEPDLSNAVLTISANSLTAIKNIPLTAFNVESSSINNRGTLFLDEPILWQGQEELVLTLKTKQPTFNTQQFARFDLLGIGLI